jgi:L-malate glycosyltransferase
VKIAIIIPRIEYCGPVIVIRNLVNSIQNTTDIKLFYLDKKIDPGIHMKVPVERYNSTFNFEDYDIIHTTGIRPDRIAYFNRRRIKCHISTVQNEVFEDLRYSHNWLFSWIFGNIWLKIWSKADILVCVSNSVKKYYEKWFFDSKLKVIRNGISEIEKSVGIKDEITSNIHDLKSKGFNVLGIVANLNRIKGIDQVIRVLSGSNLSLVIIGEGPESGSLKHLAQKLKVEDRILFCGFKRNATEYLQLFDLFIMPSRSEGFGLALIEAIQQKIPVVCSDISVFKELFNDNEVTFFEIENLDSLRNSISESLTVGSGKSELAYARYKNNYTDINMAQKYSELYNSLAG